MSFHSFRSQSKISTDLLRCEEQIKKITAKIPTNSGRILLAPVHMSCYGPTVTRPLPVHNRLALNTHSLLSTQLTTSETY